jgi:thiol:disulfide interchange protein DsbC
MKHLRSSMVAVIFIVTLLTIPIFQSGAFGEKGDKKVRESLQKLIPGTSILSIQPAPLKGFWEVVINDRGKKAIIYVDPKREYIFSGSIIHISSRTDLTKRKLDEINKVDISTIPLDDALIIGDPKAKHKLIVFNDPD